MKMDIVDLSGAESYEIRVPVVTDDVGYGWSAVPHGTLLPVERDQTNFHGDDLVRLAKRGGSTTQNARFTVHGARALAAQLIEAADFVEAAHQGEKG